MSLLVLQMNCLQFNSTPKFAYYADMLIQYYLQNNNMKEEQFYHHVTYYLGQWHPSTVKAWFKNSFLRPGHTPI